MNAIERLVAAGIDRETAGETVSWFLSHSDEERLDLYIRFTEEKQYQLCMNNA